MALTCRSEVEGLSSYFFFYIVFSICLNFNNNYCSRLFEFLLLTYYLLIRCQVFFKLLIFQLFRMFSLRFIPLISIDKTQYFCYNRKLGSLKLFQQLNKLYYIHYIFGAHQKTLHMKYSKFQWPEGLLSENCQGPRPTVIVVLGYWGPC